MKFPGQTAGPVLFLLLLLSCGCGRKGALIPPEALVPAPIADLAVMQRGDYFQLKWSAPTRQQAGARLSDLAGFTLLRRVLLPADLDCEECPGAYSVLARIDLDYLRQTRRIGNLLFFDDRDLKPGDSYQYKVRSFATQGAGSRDSNRVHRTLLTPPSPPVIEARSTGTGVVLTFAEPPPRGGKPAGYNIYRSKSGEPMPLAPLNPQPVTGTTYEDRQLSSGVRYGYTVRSVAIALKGEEIESTPSNLAVGALLEPD